MEGPISKLKGRFYQILWPSQKTWTLAQVVVQIKVATYSYFVQNDKQPQLKSRRCSALFFNPDNVSYACQYKENEVAIKQRAIFFLPSSLTGEKWIKMGVLRRALFPGVDYTVWVYLLPTYILLGTVGGYVRLRQGNLKIWTEGGLKNPYSFTKTKYLKEIYKSKGHDPSLYFSYPFVENFFFWAQLQAAKIFQIHQKS